MRIQLWIAFILSASVLLCTSHVARSLDLSQDPEPIRQEDRSLAMFRILNDVGIKLENTRARALRFIELREVSRARELCDSFVKEVKRMRDTLQKQPGLTREDVRYVDNSLEGMQKRIELIIDDLPISN